MVFPWLAAATLGAGAFSAFGQSRANSANASIGRENNAFSAREAAMNRDFQERMSNTSWQRGVADMRAAGINPMLSYSEGGASSPSGNSAQGIATANQQNEIAGAAASARDSLMLKYQLQNLQADTSVKQATAANTAALTPGVAATSAYTANKYGVANDAISLVKRSVGYSKNVNSAKAVVSQPGFISRSIGNFQDYVHSKAYKPNNF